MTIDPRAARDALTKPWLPEDPDVDVEGGGGRSTHLHPVYVLYVALGGFIGTGLREALSLWVPAHSGRMNWTILVVNVLGAFVLGFLLAFLANGIGEKGRRRTLRLMLGTGALGGFTTYSTFATGAAELIRAGHTGTAVGYCTLTVGLGLLASVAGITAGSTARETGRR